MNYVSDPIYNHKISKKSVERDLEGNENRKILWPEKQILGCQGPQIINEG